MFRFLRKNSTRHKSLGELQKRGVLLLFFLFILAHGWAQTSSTKSGKADLTEVTIPADSLSLTAPLESLSTQKVFIPNAKQAVWYSALCPGLGQIYNRKYWKLPLVIGGFAGIYYGYTWNNQNFVDYSNAYLDIMDPSRGSKSYMDLLPIGTDESSVDKAWLTGVMKRRKDFFRRNRDLCIIGAVALYAASLIDAYVDASLFDFDVTPDLSLRVEPSIQSEQFSGGGANLGLRLAFTF